MALLETGAPFTLARVDFGRDEQHGADYLRLNPRGQVPTLVVDGRAHFESAALVMLLAERHPEAGLAPPVGSALRADWYQWIAFLASSVGPVFRLWFYPSDLGTPEHPTAQREALKAKIESAWTLLDGHLAAGGPYLLGRDFSAADVLALMYMRWSRNMPRPATAWPALRDYAGRLRARPSWKRLNEAEGLTEWLA
jgi:glutathione S-transferase